MLNRRGVIAVLVLGALLAGACGTRDQIRSADGVSSPSAGARTRVWSRLPGAPLTARHGADGFWVEDTFLVMGGRDTPACPPGATGCMLPDRPALRDGARYWPDERRWTSTADAPVPLGEASTASTEGVVYWWLPDQMGEKDTSVLAYDVDRDRWEVLPPPPEPARQGWLQLTGVDDEIVAYWPAHGAEPRSPDLVYDPTTSTWQELPMDPLGPSYDRLMVWTGRELILFGLDLTRDPSGEEPSLYRAAALDLESGEWRRYPDSDILGGSLTWLVAGDVVVNPMLGSADGGETNPWGREVPYGGVLDPRAGAWSPLPAAPSPAAGFAGRPAADDRVVFNGQGELLDMRTGTWTHVPRPPSQRDAEHAEGYAVALGGGHLYTWGGVVWDTPEGTLSAAGWTFPAP